MSYRYLKNIHVSIYIKHIKLLKNKFGVCLANLLEKGNLLEKSAQELRAEGVYTRKGVGFLL